MLKRLKDKELWLRLISMLLIAVMSYNGVMFSNAGDSYQQATAFRIFCICFSALVLVNLPKKDTLTLASLLYLPLCYVFTHYAYEQHLIPDTCDYKFVEIIRMGKLVILGWGLMFLALLKHLIREDLPRRFFAYIKEKGALACALPLLWCLYVIVLTLANPGYAYVIVFTVGFSAVFILCRDEAVRERLFKAYLDGVLICFFFLLQRALRRRPYDTERYLFYFSNENMAGMYLSTVLISLVLRLDRAWKCVKEKGGKLKLVLIHILLLCCGILVAYNFTRTYLLGSGFALFVYFVIRMKKSKEKMKFALHFFLPLLLILLCMYPGYLVIRYTPALFDDPVFFYGEEGNPTRVQKGDPIDSPSYTSIQRYLTLSLGKMGIDLHIEDTEEQREKAEEEGVVTLNPDRDVSNGRMWVWSLFLKEMSLKGHNPGHVIAEDRVIYHAHNTYFQNAFQYGIPAGVLFGLLIFASWLQAVILNLKTKQPKAAVTYALLAMSTMMVGMLTEWSGHPVYPFGLLWLTAMTSLLYAECPKKDPA
ncbi:MAG: hypothetical protein IK115_09830 [Lachnospiraceae bacterium]|nr:hypothetical protein [Lachnospiraceae bacterium]